MPVPDEERDRATAVGEITGEVAGRLAVERTGQMVGAALSLFEHGGSSTSAPHSCPVVLVIQPPWRQRQFFSSADVVIRA